MCLRSVSVGRRVAAAGRHHISWRNDAMTLTRWSPVSGLAALEVDRLNRMFEPRSRGEPLSSGALGAAVDIFETARTGSRRQGRSAGDEARGHQGDVREQRAHDRGRARSSPTPDDADSITAWSAGTARSAAASRCRRRSTAGRRRPSYQDGVLTVKLPRREETRPRQIQIKAEPAIAAETGRARASRLLSARRVAWCRSPHAVAVTRACQRRCSRVHLVCAAGATS